LEEFFAAKKCLTLQVPFFSLRHRRRSPENILLCIRQENAGEKMTKIHGELKMNESTQNAALVSLEAWNAIHDEMRKAFTFQENSQLSADEFQAAAQINQFQPAD
jgi:hypothetical protein